MSTPPSPTLTRDALPLNLFSSLVLGQTVFPLTAAYSHGRFQHRHMASQVPVAFSTTKPRDAARAPRLTRLAFLLCTVLLWALPRADTAVHPRG